jgi:hypothetical protein
VLEDEKKTHALVDDLLSAHRVFDFIDEITLCELVSEKGVLNHRNDYGTIVLPYVKFIPEDTAQALYRYVSNGGRVVLVADVPVVLSAKPEKLNTNGMEHVNGNPSDVLSAIAVIKGNGAEDVFVSRYVENNKNLFFLYNRSKNIFRGSCEGIAVEVQPVSGLMLDDAYRLENAQDKILELNSDWMVEFGENQLAMNFMHVFADAEIDNADYGQGKPCDLMLREKKTDIAGSSKILYRYRFTSSGNISGTKIVMEASSVSGNWKLYVNGMLIDKWEKKRFYDCNNIFAEIELKQGSSPLVNVIDIITDGGELKEVPYLYGNFRCSYPHGHRSFPDISATEKVFEAGILSDWADWGYPAYSGRAAYAKTFEIENGGTYMLDLGRVEDIAEIAVDDMAPVILAWSPYQHKFELSPGVHCIRLTVTNGPGNMFRQANLPAGMLGPVRLLTMASLTEKQS